VSILDGTIANILPENGDGVERIDTSNADNDVAYDGGDEDFADGDEEEPTWSPAVTQPNGMSKSTSDSCIPPY
jgi:hypothetical protein